MDKIKNNDINIILIFSVLATIVAYLDRVNISVAILEMEQQIGVNLDSKAWLLSAFNLGYMVAQIPGSLAATRWGGAKVLIVVLACCSVLTLLTPIAAFSSIFALLVVRVALGIAEGALFPAIFMLLGKVVPKEKRSSAAAVVFSGVPGGTLVGLVLSGVIIGEFGWQYLFYYFGCAGAIWVAAWTLYLRNNKFLTIVSEAAPQDQGKKLGAPWGIFLRSSAVWAQVTSQFVMAWTLYLVIAWLPSYLRDVQGVEVSTTGFYSAAPWLVMFVSINVIGWVVDTISKHYANLTRIRKVVQAVGLIGAGITLFFAPDAGSARDATLLMCILLFFMSFVSSGVTANFMDLAPSYAGVLVAFANTAGQLAGFIGIASTGWIIAASGSYDSVFLLAAGLNIFGAIVWVLFCSAEPITD